ncbi:MAG: ATP-binding cassette domain-containing protein [Rubripirellula sp.]
MKQSVIELVDVTRRDSKTGRTLLAGVNLSVVIGDAIGLVGPSGSGKSTMLRAIARLDSVDDGQIRFRGDIVTADRVPAFRRSVVYLAQRPALGPGTVLQNLTLPFTFASATDSFDRAEAIALLSSLGRGESILDQDASTLSGGEQQLVALVRAILVSPQVMLLDEPTASLDATLVQRFEMLARQWKDAGADRVWIWTSHDADQIGRVSSRTVRLENGSVKHE